MNTIEKLNNIINYIDISREKKRQSTSISFDDISLDDLNLEIVVGSKVNIQSEKESFNLNNDVLLENYLKSISQYKKYRNKTPKYSLNTIDLDLDINLEINQKILVEKTKTLKKTPKDIKRDINITLLENLKTSIFLYNNVHREKNYRASFDDLYLDIELESITKKVNKVYDTPISKDKLSTYLSTNGEKNKITNKARIDILKEKLDNIKKFKKRAINYNKLNDDFNAQLDNDLNISVTLTKTGRQLISLDKKNRIKKLEQLLESINSYKERRNEL